MKFIWEIDFVFLYLWRDFVTNLVTDKKIFL